MGLPGPKWAEMGGNVRNGRKCPKSGRKKEGIKFMPKREIHVDPELFLSYKGVKIYHAYANDDWDNRLTYWYTTDVTERTPSFDVRDLKYWPKKLPSVCEELVVVLSTLRLAIDTGEITACASKENLQNQSCT
jgi:hypothetical protein